MVDGNGSEPKADDDIESLLLEPGAVMSLAFASECEGLRLAMMVRNGAATVKSLIEVAEETHDSEPMLALGWLKRWALEDKELYNERIN